MIETIRRLVPTLLPDSALVTDILPVSQARQHAVWKVTTQSGLTLAVKHHLFAPFTKDKPYDLLDVEQRACALLRSAGAPVPKLYGINRDHHLVFSEWCGDLTLDDLCQEADPDALEQIAINTIDGFLAFEAAFHLHTPGLSAHAFPGCAPEDLLETWLDTTGQVSDLLPNLIAYLNPTAQVAPLQDLWSDLVQTLGQAPPTFGPTDYNARNIVVKANRICFLECAKLGWDWSERRLVQYTTGLGAGHPCGNFNSLLTPKRAAQYAARAAEYRPASPDQILHLLDGHHAVFHLLAASRLVASDESLHLAWQNPDDRRAQLCRILGLPLSDNPLITQLRSFFLKKN